ncbi:ribonucleotide reductase subunit NrdJb [Metapseudomonas resinovorans NBRC 106553]|uniref:ribonucleoside-diphosphate reductase n=1 Tax=Metapseudomonas resinovorans NBRC 106553 TaxID=1245471 RepID=S6ABT0_METRE|nr:ribonucleotide reductase subunit NrdJb [Pseudomonas resinovorans NBRC 106553]
MTIKIEKKIKGFSLVDLDQEKARKAAEEAAAVVQMDETLQRPETLVGATYKIKSPLFEHALYVTINDIVLNPGTAFEQRRPFEIFINSKGMEHFQWIVALTRIMSAVFRKGGDCTFLVEELKAVFDPRGGYLKRGGIYMPSLVAEIGAVLERHLVAIGLMEGQKLDEEHKLYLAEKRAAYEASLGTTTAEPGEGFPPRRPALRQVQHPGGGADGRLRHLPQLRPFEMWVSRIRRSMLRPGERPAMDGRAGVEPGHGVTTGMSAIKLIFATQKHALPRRTTSHGWSVRGAKNPVGANSFAKDGAAVPTIPQGRPAVCLANEFAPT